MKNISISAFFPAYNEEANIEATVRKAEEVLSGISDQYEIIIVNDGSRDATGLIAEKLSKEMSNVRVIQHEKNQGYGAALWSGIKAAKNDWVFFSDADLQFDLREINKLLEYVPEYQIVIGYRAPRRDPFMRLVNAWGWHALVRMMFGLKVKDMDCAFKIFRRELVADLPIVSKGATTSAEILIRLQEKGIKWKEVPVSHFPRKAGSPTGAKFSVIIRAFKELFKLYRMGI